MNTDRLTPQQTSTISPGGPRLAVVLDGSGAAAAEVGGKGAALDRLVGWGFAVPPVAVITAEAYRLITAAPSVVAVLDRLAHGEAVDAAAVDDAFAAAEIPPELRCEIARVAERVRTGRSLAIRSSATVEDLGRSSFAGQYRSLLDVPADDPAALGAAVLAVFASLHHPAPRAYRRALGIAETGISMAVVMMPMIAAEQAGVVFTEDPGEPAIVRIEIVDGMGESLVSGRRTPRVVLIPRREAADETDPEIRPIVTAALAIEQRAGCPQDIEWARDGSTVWIVQARPITTIGASAIDEFDDPDLDDAELTTEGIGEMLAGILPPLLWDIDSTMVEEAFRTMLDRMGADTSVAPGAHWLVRRVHGRAALDVGRLSALMRRIPGAEDRLRDAYFGDRPVPAGRRSGLELLRVAHHGVRAARARRRASFDAEVVVHAAHELMATAPSLADWSIDRLAARHRALVGLATRGVAAELMVSADAGAIVHGLQALLGRYFPPDEAARWALAVTVPDPIASPTASASATVFGGPTWVESRWPRGASAPAPVVRGEVAERLMQALADRPPWPAPGLRRHLARRRLDHLAGRAALQLTRRERSKISILALGGEVRRIHLELGRRLAERELLATAEDVELLTIEEAVRMLGEGSPVSARVLESRRRALLRHAAEDPLPNRFRGKPPIRTLAPADPGDRLTGWPASGGRFRGVARRATGPDSKVGRDEVLVAEATDPSWSPLLMRSGAIVLERGGPLSHAAIIAREFGVPAVLNVPGAVAALTGRTVLVDGDAGVVDRLPADSAGGVP